jgi:hypothetical protein
MNQTQLQTTLAPIVAAIAGSLAARGFLGLDTAGWTTILFSLLAVAAVAWPAIVTRAQSLKDTVGKLPATTVITDVASANALPNNPDVVAATPAIVKAINDAK